LAVLFSVYAAGISGGLVVVTDLSAPRVVAVETGGKTHAPGTRACAWLEYDAGSFRPCIVPGLDVPEGAELSRSFKDGSEGSWPVEKTGAKALVLAKPGRGEILIVTDARLWEIDLTQGDETVWYAEISDYWQYGEPDSQAEVMEMEGCGPWGYFMSDLSFGEGEMSARLVDGKGKKVSSVVVFR